MVPCWRMTKTRFEPSPERKRELAARFFAALNDGDVDGLVQMLADDAVMVGDGGGKGAVRTPVHGTLRIARFLVGLGRLGDRYGIVLAPAIVNGQPGAIAHIPGGPVTSTLSLEIADGKVIAIHSVVNPEKLRRLQSIV